VFQKLGHVFLFDQSTFLHFRLVNLGQLYYIWNSFNKNQRMAKENNEINLQIYGLMVKYPGIWKQREDW